MKRDMDMIRDILLAIEECYNDPVEPIENFMPKANEQKVSYHLKLMHEARLIEALDVSGAEGICWEPKCLTYTGHDFLDAVRDPDIWKKTKNAAERAGGFSLDLLADLAKGLIKTQIEKYTGIKV